MRLPLVRDSACNQAPACNRLPLLFICSFSKRHRAAARAACFSIWKEEGGYEGCCAISIPLRFPPPMPGTVRLWQVPQGQTVSFNKLWVTVSDKSPSYPPPQLGGFLYRQLCFHTCRAIPRHTCDRGGQVPFYASLAHGVDFHMRELDGTRAKMCSISPSCLIGQSAHFSRAAAGSHRAACLPLSHTHTRLLNKYVI